MMSAEEYQRLTRVGPGTPMGEMMRQYWIPAAASDELEANGAPMRLKLLGEKLIADGGGLGLVGTGLGVGFGVTDGLVLGAKPLEESVYSS